MLHILLLILKIIGILLLCLLGVLVLGIAFTLFVPVRYRIEAVRKEGVGEPPVVLRVKVTWLLHFVNLFLLFDGSLFVRARIMIFTLFRLPKKEKKRRGRGRKKPEQSVGDETETLTFAKTQGEKRGNGTDAGESGPSREQEGAVESEITENTENTEDRPNESTSSRPNESITVSDEEEEESGEKPSLLDKVRVIPKILRGIFSKIRSFFENIQYTIRKFCDKIRSVSDTIEYYRSVIEGEAFQRSLALCKGELIRIGKSLKPQKFQAQLLIGMDDPAATGQILAVCGMLYPLLGGHVDVAGDFDRKRLEGHVFVKGKIRFFTFLRVAVKVYFNKDIRKLYKLLKKEAV